MNTFEPPLQLNAVEYRGLMRGGQTHPRLVAAVNNNWEYKEIVLKVRHPETPKGHGHYGEISSTVELICAILARSLGFSVPDYAIVNIERAFVDSIHDHGTRELFKKNIGENFGTVYHASYALWNPEFEKTTQTIIEQLEDVLTFDATVINGDRKREKPNLLYRGEDIFLIDHSLALPVYLWDDELVKQSPNFPDNEILSHCSASNLKGKRCRYKRVFEDWQINLNTDCFQELKSMIPNSWVHNEEVVYKIFSFLEQRKFRFTDISNNLIKVLS